jgi:hypothetical protein
MKINIIANQMRTERGETLTVDMLKAELSEVKSLKAKTPYDRQSKKRHVDALTAMITYKEKRQTV